MRILCGIVAQMLRTVLRRTNATDMQLLPQKGSNGGMSITMSDDQRDGAAAPTSPEQVIEVARAVTRQLAPEELLVFDDVAAVWSSGSERRPRRVRGPKVGIGFESVLLSQLLFPIIAGAIGQVLGTLAMEQIQPRHRGRHSAGARRDERLTSKQARDLHDKCQELARAKLPPAEAAQLADAILDTLRCEHWRS